MMKCNDMITNGLGFFFLFSPLSWVMQGETENDIKVTPLWKMLN